jgi:hypothetical protein
VLGAIFILPDFFCEARVSVLKIRFSVLDRVIRSLAGWHDRRIRPSV